jgi:hypothetical protein
MSGALRWVTWGDRAEWHLRFGPDGQTLCDRWPTKPGLDTRWLSQGAPANRCRNCATVIRFRLGLSPVTEGEPR